MRSSVCPALTTAAIVHGLGTDHDRRRGQRCIVLTHPVSLIHRGESVQINRATSSLEVSQVQIAKAKAPIAVVVGQFDQPCCNRFII